MPTVLTERRDRALVVTINRPEARNAVNAEVAQGMVKAVEAGPGGRLPEIAGPEVHSAEELARAWLKARGKRRLLVPLPLFAKVAAGFRVGYNCAPDARYGRITWAGWLGRKYG